MASRRLAHPAPGLHQQRIARWMSERIVDRFELVKIEAVEREQATIALGGTKHMFELLLEHAAVREAGQRIGLRLVLGLLEPRGVEDHRRGLLAHAAEDPPVFVGEAPGNRVVDHEPANQP